MDQPLQRQTRVNVEVSVTVTTVLETLDAIIVDMTEDGALITGCTLDEGTRFQIEYMGETIYAQCRWSEVDRMGVRFVFTLEDGALHQRLIMARAAHHMSEMASDAVYAAQPRAFTRVPTVNGFGKRSS